MYCLITASPFSMLIKNNVELFAVPWGDFRLLTTASLQLQDVKNPMLFKQLVSIFGMNQKTNNISIALQVSNFTNTNTNISCSLLVRALVLSPQTKLADNHTLSPAHCVLTLVPTDLFNGGTKQGHMQQVLRDSFFILIHSLVRSGN